MGQSKIYNNFKWQLEDFLLYVYRILRKTISNINFFFLKNKLNKIVINRAGRVALEITNACNANCSFCAYRYQQRSVGIMTNETYREFLKKYIEYGGGELKFTPLVGDPLVDKNIIEKIKIAKESNKITYIYTYTNGIGFDRLDIKAFLESVINEIQISTCSLFSDSLISISSHKSIGINSDSRVCKPSLTSVLTSKFRFNFAGLYKCITSF